jgi:hypothetical protein
MDSIWRYMSLDEAARADWNSVTPYEKELLDRTIKKPAMEAGFSVE